jgi:hypothetical protein
LVKSFFRDIEEDARVIVFCQSRNCEFDRQVATKISICGLKNVCLFEEGFRGYQKILEMGAIEE